jgi:hypothetical protein
MNMAGLTLTHVGPIDPKTIRTAPSGKFRVVETDPRDQWPTPVGDHESLADARQCIRRAWGVQAEAMAIYDQHGHRWAA